MFIRWLRLHKALNVQLNRLRLLAENEAGVQRETKILGPDDLTSQSKRINNIGLAF